MRFAASTVQTSFDSPLGRIIVAASDDKLVGVWFDSQRHLPDTSSWIDGSHHPVLHQAQRQLSEYFTGHRTTFELPLDLSNGTLFQQKVWRTLLKIPRGATWTYAAVSAAIGKPAAVRAVGGAIGRNPLGIVVPCHRVIGANGSLTGYAGGLDRKVALLKLESGH
jgi:methylated-DNA-[protein]-cysteine S-methyltransferase